MIRIKPQLARDESDLSGESIGAKAEDSVHVWKQNSCVRVGLNSPHPASIIDISGTLRSSGNYIL